MHEQVNRSTSLTRTRTHKFIGLSGGAFHLIEDGTFSAGLRFTAESNQAYLHGGAFACWDTTAEFLGAINITNNVALTGDGGGAYVNATAVDSSRGITYFTSNSAPNGRGGGLFIEHNTGTGNLYSYVQCVLGDEKGGWQLPHPPLTHGLTTASSFLHFFTGRSSSRIRHGRAVACTPTTPRCPSVGRPSASSPTLPRTYVAVH